MSNKDDTDPVTFPDKWMKVIKSIPEFRDTADAAGTEDLNKIVLLSEGNIYTIEKERSEDIKLNSAKILAKEYGEPYTDAIKVQTAKIKYAMFLLEGKGAVISEDNDED